MLLLPLSTPRIYASDEVQYYAYLRSIYFDGDLDFSNEYAYFAERGLQNNDPAVYNALLRDNPKDPPRNLVTGKLRNVAPIGAAILWSPGFLLADAGVRVAQALGSPIQADGYSAPYIWAVCFMSALYALLGLVLTYRLARRFTGMFAATLATVTVWLASPLVFYTYILMPWSHSTGFFLFALFLTLWLPEKLFEKDIVSSTIRGGKRILEGRPSQTPPFQTVSEQGNRLITQQAQRSWRSWLFLGITAALLTMTREQYGLVLLLPAVEGLVAYAQFLKARQWRAFGRLALKHTFFLVTLIIVMLPQLLTYQVLNGQPLPSSTVSDKLQSAGGLSPHFFATLIDLEHGAFLWSPILAIGCVGLCWLARRDGLLVGLLFLEFVAQTYVNGAFGSTWHLTGAFGYRRLIECTPIFVLGLAALIEQVQRRTGPIPLLLIAVLLIGWNIGLIAQWTIVRSAEHDIRRGLVWNDMLQYQFIHVPQKILGSLGDLLINRCRLVQNRTC